MLKLDVSKVFRGLFCGLKLLDFIFGREKNLIAFPSGLRERKVFPLYKVEGFTIEDLFIEDLFDLVVVLVEVHVKSEKIKMILNFR